MEGTRKRRRTDDLDQRPKVSRKLSTSSSTRDTKGDEQYRRQMYALSVRDALMKKSEGDTGPYDLLVRKFTSNSALKEASSAQELLLLVNALSHVVSQLDRRHSTLVNAVVCLHWVVADAQFVKSYITLMGLLLSAQSQYGTAVLERAVQGLTYQPDLSILQTVGTDESRRPLTRDDLYDRYHGLLEHILSIVPTLTKSLQPILARKFPHKRLEKMYHITFVRNALRLAKYSPGIADQVVSSVIERAINLDVSDYLRQVIPAAYLECQVEIQIDLDELEDEGENLDTVFDLEEDLLGADSLGTERRNEIEDEGDDGAFSDVDSEDEPDLDDDENAPEAPRDTAHVRDMASKLDAMLGLLFEHLQNQQTPDLVIPSSPTTSKRVTPTSTPPVLNPSLPNAKSPEENAERAFEIQHLQFQTLLSTFERTILRTSRSRYTQFILFWFCSLHSDFTDEFLGALVKKVITASEPIATRAAAASYLASFVSRARFVGGDHVRDVIKLLCTYLARELETYALQKEALHISHFTPFYAISQAVFLIFCFRWRDLQNEVEDDAAVDEENDDLGLASAAAGGAKTSWISELDVIHQVVVSPLNPLRFCDNVVADQFASVASKTNFASCYSIIDQNRRTSISGMQPTFVLPASAPASSSSSFSIPRSIASRSKTVISSSRSASSNSVSGLGSRSVFISSHPSAVAPSTKDFTAANIAELNRFFPFDPYELPLSRSFVDGVYRVWDEVKIGGDDDDDDDDDEDDEDDQADSSASESDSDDDDDEAPSSLDDQGASEPDVVSPSGIKAIPIALGNVAGPSSSSEELNQSFGGMSISPSRRVLEGMAQSFALSA
ncbi:RNA polymerase I-specific transcription initiation factor RRN3 [Clavulina sp. PMI_390]|nr:RNA polymerase I-specific transcription initiation factor RRN3 [Clavulina sp. PMI_390]